MKSIHAAIQALSKATGYLHSLEVYSDGSAGIKSLGSIVGSTDKDATEADIITAIRGLMPVDTSLPTIKDLLVLLDEYREKTGQQYPSVTLFGDGSGGLNDADDDRVGSVGSEDQTGRAFIELLKNAINDL